MPFDWLRRREFITLLGGATAAWPLAARAQQAGRRPTIGFLGTGSSVAWTQWTAAFVRRLGELGWIDGRNVTIKYRWAEGRAERYVEVAAEFVRLKVDVIVTGGAAIPAAMQATSTIPIVFALAVDAIREGIITNLARPGGNVTGLSALSSETASKRLQILSEGIPGLRRLAVLGNTGHAGAADEMREVQTAAKALGVEIDKLEIRRAEDIATAFERLTSGAQALYVCPDPLVNSNRVRIGILALGFRLPTMFGFREYVHPAGLMSYGPNIPDLFRRAGEYVDKILRGAKAGELPVEQPTKFELVVNLTVAKALGLKLPESLLLRADEVIE
ncbi:MAG: ABC transporter substrate-binding protein [Xanthobacteraceae bacterium]